MIMSTTIDRITTIVQDSLADAWHEYDHKEMPTIESVIYGDESMLDSMALVSMVLDIEERLEEELELTISLLDEKAFSQDQSPFRNVATMVTFVKNSIEEATGD